MNTKKRIAVTGGAGYIGSHTVVQLIEAGYDVLIIDDLSRSDQRLLDGLKSLLAIDVPFCKVDCKNYDALAEVFSKSKIDAVVHFAAFKAVGESVEKPLDYYENNLLSLTSLLRCMQSYKVLKLIFSSSCTVYGEPDFVPVDEQAPIKKANSPYGATKQMCERILEDVKILGIDVVSLRYFNPIGAHPSGLIGELPLGAPNNLVPYITQTAIGLRNHLTIFGNDYPTPDGTCIRDYIHVSDLADAHIKALSFIEQNKGNHIFNIGTGFGVSVQELVNQFEEVNQTKINFTIGPRRPGDVARVYANANLAFNVLHWKPKFTIKEALQHAWQWEKKVRSIN